MRWFDGHLDLGYLAETGRDLHALPRDARGPHQPVAVTLPALKDAGVAACLATIFTEPTDDTEAGAHAYVPGDADAAWRAGVRQLKLYHAWRDAGVIDLAPSRAGGSPTAAAPLRAGILMEGADPISAPEDAAWWAEQGVIAVGLAWRAGTRYAAGDAIEAGSSGDGLTAVGLELVAALDEAGIVHDASHLSDRSLEMLFDATDTAVIASHSNARRITAPDGGEGAARHLHDDAIREIARRGGVIGVNLFSPFVGGPLDAKTQRASIDTLIDHVEHIADVAGDRAHVALGSDMDGGFGADRLVRGIDGPGDLIKLVQALRGRGWSDPDVESFAFAAWDRFWA